MNDSVFKNPEEQVLTQRHPAQQKLNDFKIQRPDFNIDMNFTKIIDSNNIS
jgi:hypothetical protein